MSQFPHDPHADAHLDYPAEPDRTSVLAIMSLVCSLICCIPGLSAIGALLGVGSLVGIKGSRGRVGGTGLAIAGIIIGGLVTVAQIGIALGVREGVGVFLRDIMPQVHSIMDDIEAGNDAEAIAKLSPPASTGVTPDHIARFRDAYRDRLGAYQAVPTDFSGLIDAYGSVGQSMQQFNGSGGGQPEMPIPVRFDNGWVVLIVRFDPNPANPPAGNQIPITNLILYPPSGDPIALWDPVTNSAAIPPALPDAAAPDAPTPDAEAPATENPAETPDEDDQP